MSFSKRATTSPKPAPIQSPRPKPSPQADSSWNFLLLLCAVILVVPLSVVGYLSFSGAGANNATAMKTAESLIIRDKQGNVDQNAMVAAAIAPALKAAGATKAEIAESRRSPFPMAPVARKAFQTFEGYGGRSATEMRKVCKATSKSKIKNYDQLAHIKLENAVRKKKEDTGQGPNERTAAKLAKFDFLASCRRVARRDRETEKKCKPISNSKIAAYDPKAHKEFNQAMHRKMRATGFTPDDKTAAKSDEFKLLRKCWRFSQLKT